MNQQFSNYMTMAQASIASLFKDKESWANEPEIVTEMTSIEKLFNTIMGMNTNIAGLDAKVYTQVTGNDFEEIISAILKICKKLCVYARRNNDPSVLVLANHTHSSLVDGKRKDAISRCQAIVLKAESLMTNLAPYKVTPEDITNVRQLIANYELHINDRSNTKTDKTTTAQVITEHISTLRQHFIMLDDLVEAYIDDQDVINRYKLSRTIHNYGKSKTIKNKEIPTAPSTIPTV